MIDAIPISDIEVDDATRPVLNVMTKTFRLLRRAFHQSSHLPLLIRALLTRHGLPLRLYVDNDADYRSHQLASSCALKLGIALIHARRCRSSAGKGQAERFFMNALRTARGSNDLGGLDARLTTGSAQPQPLGVGRGRGPANRRMGVRSIGAAAVEKWTLAGELDSAVPRSRPLPRRPVPLRAAKSPRDAWSEPYSLHRAALRGRCQCARDGSPWCCATKPK